MSLVETVPAWDDLDTDALIVRKAVIDADIIEINAQIADQTRRGHLGTPVAYHQWLASAKAAKAAKRAESNVLKGIIFKRRRAFERANRKARASRRAEACANPAYTMHSSAAEFEAARQAAIQKRALLLETLRSGEGVDALLLRLRRALVHICEGYELPEECDEADREALHALALYLRDKFGKGAVREYLEDELTDSEAAS
jgi:uncharacterized membrane protein YccC